MDPNWGLFALTALAMAGGFYVWWRTPAESIIATVQPSFFAIPPSIAAEIEAAAQSVSEEETKFFERYPKHPEKFDEAYHRAKEIAGDLRRKVLTGLSFRNRLYSGVWHAVVENTGAKSCTGGSG